MNNIENYRTGDTVQLLVSGSHIGAVMEDWLKGLRTCDLRVRRAKTRGSVVIETTDLMYAAHIVQRYPDVKTNLKKQRKHGKESIQS